MVKKTKREKRQMYKRETEYWTIPNVSCKSEFMSRQIIHTRVETIAAHNSLLTLYCVWFPSRCKFLSLWPTAILILFVSYVLSSFVTCKCMILEPLIVSYYCLRIYLAFNQYLTIRYERDTKNVNRASYIDWNTMVLDIIIYLKHTKHSFNFAAKYYWFIKIFL